MEVSELTVQEVTALYFDQDALRITPRPLYRLAAGSAGRYYYTFGKQGAEFFISVTNLIKATMPTPAALIAWIAKNGSEGADEIKFERAGYGTMMHKFFEELLITRTLNLDLMREQIAAYLEEERLPAFYAEKWEPELKKDALAFAQFMQDFNVVPLGIELMLASSQYGFAGALDLVCRMTIEVPGFSATEVYASGPRKGQSKECKVPVEIVAIVDFKSGKKGFYEEHEIQLEAYRLLVEENFPDLKIDRLYNFAPNEWRGTTPTYKLKDQTESPNRKKLPFLVELGRIQAAKRSDTVTTYSGVVNLDRNFLADCVQVVTLENFVTSKRSK